ISSPHYLKWNAKGASDGELVFTSGHPGSTQRLSTYVELQANRDLYLPSVIQRIKQRIAVRRAYAARGPEQERQVMTGIFGLENSLKSFEGSLRGLQDRNLMEKKRKEEEDFKALVMANPEWKKQYGSAWDDIAAAVEKQKSRSRQGYRTLDSQYANLALT